MPRHKGGSDEPSNIQWLCANCHQDKTALEMSAVHKGKKKSPEHIAKIIESNRNRPVSQETKDKIRASVLAGLTEERLHKIREGMKRRVWPNGHPHLGKSPSPETRAKISEALRKRYRETGADAGHN